MDQHMLQDGFECGFIFDADLDGPGGRESRAGGPLGGHHPSSASKALHGDSFVLKTRQGTARRLAAIKPALHRCQCRYSRAMRGLCRGFKIGSKKWAIR